MAKQKTKKGKPSTIAPPQLEPPPKQISFEEIAEVMLAHAKQGGFLSTAGAAFYERFGTAVACRTIDRLAQKNPEMKAIKTICKSLCSHYWDGQLKMGAVAPAAWVFIKKNVDKWTDRVAQTGEFKINNKNPDEMSPEEILAEIKQVISQLQTDEGTDE